MENCKKAWSNTDIFLCIVGYLDQNELTILVECIPYYRNKLNSLLKSHKLLSYRCSLSIWLAQNLTLEFQSHRQDLENVRLSRSSTHDPRVPPLIRSVWSDRGPIGDGSVVLKAFSFPTVHPNGFNSIFKATQATVKPMLVDAVQGIRRIYTVVTLKLQVQAVNEPIELRKYCYIKEFGEWKCPTPQDKKMYTESCGQCRYDVITEDGTFVLELDVPKGADSMLDFYLVKQLLIPLFPERRAAVAEIVCRSLSGKFISSLQLDSHIYIDSSNFHTEGVGDQQRASQRTELVEFEVVTFQATSRCHFTPPVSPGYIWLRIKDKESRGSIIYAVMLHGKARRVHGKIILQTTWLPGILQYYSTSDSIQRRKLKGQFQMEINIPDDTDTMREVSLKVVAQHISTDRLQRFAAKIYSYTGL